MLLDCMIVHLVVGLYVVVVEIVGLDPVLVL